MKFLGLWMLCLVIGKARVLGNAGQCQGQGKCTEPQILNGKASLPPVVTETPAAYGDYDYYTYGAGDGDGASTYDSGTEMSVTCTDSYWFKGTNKSVGSIRCCDGRWDPGVNEACVAAKCDLTPQFGGALKHLSSCFAGGANLTAAVAANSSACLHCLDGFKIRNQEGLKDSIEVQCGNDGKWKIPLHCENQIACTRPAPSERRNTYSRIKENFDAMLQMEFECTSRDFIMHGSPVVKCLAGKWDVDPLPVCRHKSSCLLAIEHGQITTSPGSVDTHGPWARNRDSGTVTCDQGHDSITDDDTLTCNWGKWEPAPHCVEPGLIGKCVTPPLRYGNVTLTTKKTIPGTVATHTCASGYALEGAVNRTCLRDGSWNGKEATCVLKATCDKPQTIAHAWDPPDKAYYHNEKYRYICRSGYERRGGSYYQCDANSNRWEPLSFDTRRMRCEPVNCGKPSGIPNAVPHLVDGRSTSFGAEVRYQCKTGYEQTRGILMSRICQANGRWTVIGLQCDIVTCPPLTNPLNGRVEIRRGRSNRYEYESEYKFTCDSRNGYRLKGKQIDDTTLTKCTEYGNWSHPPTTIACELVDCYDPGHIYRGYLQAGNTTYPSQRQFGCNDFTTMEPVYAIARAFIICQKDGQWSKSLPKCWGKCRVPVLNVATGYYRTTQGLRFSQDALEHGNDVNIHCEGGYTTDIRNPSSSTKTLKCDNGTLTQGSCTEKPCDELTKSDENLSNVIYNPSDVIDVWPSRYYKHGTTADITCLNTHETANRGSTLRLTCNKRSWNKRNPICKPKECLIPISASTDLRLYTTDWHGRATYYHRREYVVHDKVLSISCSASKTVFNSTMKRNPLTTKCTYGKWENPAFFEETCVPDPCSKLNENRLVVDSVHYSMPIVSLRRADYVRHGTNVSFTCKPKYETSEHKPSGWVKCDTGKYKPGNLPRPEVCKEKECIIPTSASFDLRLYTTDRYGGTTYRSREHYLTHGTELSIRCSASKTVFNSTMKRNPLTTKCTFGKWENPTVFDETCVPDPCSKLNEGRLVVDSVHYSEPIVSLERTDYVRHGTNVSFTCKPKYEVSEHKPSGWVECDTGKYQPVDDSQPEVCKAKGCRVPSHADRKYVIRPSSLSYPFDRYFNHRDWVNVTCEDGFVLDSTKTNPGSATKCSFGIWSYPGAFGDRCIEAPCELSKWEKDGMEVAFSNPTISINAREHVAHGNTIDVFCKNTHYLYEWRLSRSFSGGYWQAILAKSARCEKGMWDPRDTEVSCKAKGCTCPVDTDTHSFECNSKVPHGGTAGVKCKAGFEFASTGVGENRNIDCQFGNFTEPPSCRNASCLLTDRPTANGGFIDRTIGSTLLHGDSATFQCHKNYEFDMGEGKTAVNTTSRCIKGKLQPKLTCKKVTGSCNFPIVTNGSWRVVSPFKSIFIECNSGFLLAGGDTIVDCGSAGSWKNGRSDERFQCKACSNVEMLKKDGGGRSPSESVSRRARGGNVNSLDTCKMVCVRNAECSSVKYDVSSQNCTTSPGRMETSSGDVTTYWKVCACPTISVDDNVEVSNDERTIGSFMTLKCKQRDEVFPSTGFGTLKLHCRENGTWDYSAADLKCETNRVEQFSCDFEDGLCIKWSLVASGNFNWTLASGTTASSPTGPNSDQSKGGSYVYVETTRRTQREKAFLLSPKTTESGYRCLRFYYHMSGRSPGQLRVIYKTEHRGIFGTYPEWKRSDSSGDNWWLATVDVAFDNRDEQIGFEGMVESRPDGRIAIDDITLTKGKCPRKACPPVVQRSAGIRVTGGNGPDEDVTLECSNRQKQLKITCQRNGTWSVSPTTFDCGDRSSTTTATTKVEEGIEAAATVPTEAAPTTTSEAAPTTTEMADTTTLTLAERFRCNFDSDLCKWTHDPSGNFYWIRHQGYLPDERRRWTGPRSDHTTRNGHYMYMSSSRALGTKVRLKSQELGSRGPKCFEFYYNKYSSETVTHGASTLNVYVGSALSPVFSDNGTYRPQHSWIHKRMNVIGLAHQKIIIEGVVGSSKYRDIAIDDVSLSEGSCPDCSDLRPDCSYYKGRCPSSPAVRKQCVKTCGLCPEL